MRRAKPVELIANLLVLLQSVDAPSWYKPRISSWLSKTVMRPQGVFAVFQNMLNSVPVENTKKFEKIVDLVLRRPRVCKSDEEYIQCIGPQLVTLLHAQFKSMDHVKRATVMTIARLTEKHPTLAQRFVWDKLNHPLKQFIDFQQVKCKIVHQLEEEKETTGMEQKPQILLVNDNDLVQCVEDLHIVLLGYPVSQSFLDIIGQVIPALFQLYCFVRKTKLNVKSACEEVIAMFFKWSDNALYIVKKLVIFQRTVQRQWHVKFAAGDAGGVCIRAEAENERDYMYEADCLLELLSLMKNNDITGDLFVHLITQFTVMKEEVEMHRLRENNLLLDNDELEERVIGDDTVLLLQVIKLMIEKFGSAIMKNATQTLAFVKFLLLIHEDSNNGEDEDVAEKHENISTALGILSALLAGGFSLEHEKHNNTLAEFDARVQDIVPILQRLAKYLADAQIADMAATALLCIESKQYLLHVGIQEPDDADSRNNSKLTTILADLRDPLLPVRAHGVLQLRQLVLAKEPAMKKHVGRLLSIFETQLKDDDSYVYLAAILGLEAMGDVYPDEVIPVLTNAFKNEKRELELENVLKLGDALMHIAERTGQMLPKYAPLFANAFLTVCHNNYKFKSHSNQADLQDELDQNAYLHAAALSNLATLCETLRFAVSPYLQDILDCAYNMLLLDKHPVVRRMSVQLFLRLVKGMQKQLFEVVQESQMQRIIDGLRTAQFYDSDALVKHNAHMVLEQIDHLAMERLKPANYDDWHASPQPK